MKNISNVSQENEGPKKENESSKKKSSTSIAYKIKILLAGLLAIGGGIPQAKAGLDSDFGFDGVSKNPLELNPIKQINPIYQMSPQGQMNPLLKHAAEQEYLDSLQIENIKKILETQINLDSLGIDSSLQQQVEMQLDSIFGGINLGTYEVGNYWAGTQKLFNDIIKIGDANKIPRKTMALIFARYYQDLQGLEKYSVVLNQMNEIYPKEDFIQKAQNVFTKYPGLSTQEAFEKEFQAYLEKMHEDKDQSSRTMIMVLVILLSVLGGIVGGGYVYYNHESKKNN